MAGFWQSELAYRRGVSRESPTSSQGGHCSSDIRRARCLGALRYRYSHWSAHSASTALADPRKNCQFFARRTTLKHSAERLQSRRSHSFCSPYHVFKDLSRACMAILDGVRMLDEAFFRGEVKPYIDKLYLHTPLLKRHRDSATIHLLRILRGSTRFVAMKPFSPPIKRFNLIRDCDGRMRRYPGP